MFYWCLSYTLKKKQALVELQQVLAQEKHTRAEHAQNLKQIKRKGI